MSAAGQLIRACGACGERPAWRGPGESLCDVCAEAMCRRCHEPKCAPEDGGLCRDCDEAAYEAACDAAYDAWKEDGIRRSVPRRRR